MQVEMLGVDKAPQRQIFFFVVEPQVSWGRKVVECRKTTDHRRESNPGLLLAGQLSYHWTTLAVEILHSNLGIYVFATSNFTGRPCYRLCM